jgi:hypothetical protein
LAARRRGAADDRGDLGERVAEHVVQDERDPLGRGHRLEDDQERHVYRLVEGDPVGRVGDGPLRRQRLGQPFADVALPPGPGRPELVEADAAGDPGEPGARVVDGGLLGRRHRVPAGVRLLHHVLGVGERAEQPVGEVDQLPPLVDDRTGHDPSDETTGRDVRPGGQADGSK